MKNIIKNIILCGAAAIMAAGCAKDSDYKTTVSGETGVYAYIVGGTAVDAHINKTATEIFHTPIGDMGGLEAEIILGLTKAQSSAVTITLSTDDTAISGNVSAFPAGVLEYPSTVTIPAGKTRDTITVTISDENREKLVDESYLAVFRITGVDGGLSISSNSNTAYVQAAVTVIDPTTNRVSVEGSFSEFTMINYDDEQEIPSISKRISVKGSESAFMEFPVVFAVDNTLIEAYNAENGTEYTALPEGVAVTISECTMAKDATSAYATVSISEDDAKTLVEAAEYLIPVKMTDVSPATMGTNGVTYIALHVKKIAGGANQFSSIYIGDHRMATWAKFANPLSMTQWTISFHCYIEENTAHARIGDFADKDENFINMLRIGQKGGTELEWFVGPNGNRKQLYTGNLEVETWYNIALVYTGSKLKLLVDGTKVDEADAELGTFNFQAIEFNSSWGANYRQGNEFHGRLWNVSIWNSDISSGWWATLNEIIKKDIDNYYIQYAQWYNLKAYWPMNEGYGHILHDKLSNCGDIDFTNTVRCDNESDMVSADVSEYVQWKRDAHNKFD
ncbi:MAG: DUF1735 domain-containing protein [Bacteroidales bacterium]|nr:DUF1735 domain-containing protein [Bacteroidales bacterium]